MTGFALPGLRDESLELLPLSRREGFGRELAIFLPVSCLYPPYHGPLRVSRASEPVGGIAMSNARPQRAVIQVVGTLNKSRAHGLGGPCYGDAHLPMLSVLACRFFQPKTSLYKFPSRFIR
jgi:hypothetical protein